MAEGQETGASTDARRTHSPRGVGIAVGNTAAIELICTVLENFPHDPALASLAFQCLMQLVEGSALNAHLALRCGIVEKAANIHASIGSENGDLAGLAMVMIRLSTGRWTF